MVDAGSLKAKDHWSKDLFEINEIGDVNLKWGGFYPNNFLLNWTKAAFSVLWTVVGMDMEA